MCDETFTPRIPLPEGEGKDKDDAVLRIELRDALLTDEDVLIPADTTCVIHLRAPHSWLSGDALPADRMERVYEAMYGPTWRDGNIDGSYFRVLSVASQVLSEEAAHARAWCDYDEDDEAHRYWFWRVRGDDGETLESVTAEEL
jgi:hypothetical protein